MKRSLQEIYALSDEGARDLRKGIFYSVLANVSLMLPVMLLSLMIDQLLQALGGNIMSERGLVFYLFAGLATLALMALFHHLQYTCTYLGTYRESERRRIRLAEKLRALPLSVLQRRDLADLTNTVMSDCANLEHALSHTVPQFFGAVISTGLIGAGLLVLNWRLGLALIWVAPVAFAIVLLSRRLQKHLTARHLQARLTLAEGVQECLETVQDIKACNMEKAYLAKLDTKLDAAEKGQISSEMISASLLTSGQMFLRLGLATVIVVGSGLVSAGEVTLSTYVLFLIAATRLYEPLSGAMANLTALFNVQLSVARLREIEEQPAERGDTVLHNKGYDLVFEHVAFSYSPEQPVLRDLSFAARQGQVTAIVGPSGSGKSTVVKLAAKLYSVDNGRITLGGTDVSSVTEAALMAQVAIVFQDVVLFNNTVRENIRVGRQSASDAEVIAAAKAARCHDFVMALPQGYDTVIGENGAIFSGGERQRLSIARALLKDAPVILLDEATASLDADNETEVQQATLALTRNKTVLMVAHRLRTIQQADQIIVLNDGVVYEQGSHDTLMAKNGLYRQLVERQTTAEDWRLR